jgi:hypothetical protein
VSFRHPIVKNLDDITVADFEAHPVWEMTLEYEGDDGLDETACFPVEVLPVAQLADRIIGCQVVLANGSTVWARVYAECGDDERIEALRFAFEHNGRWKNLVPPRRIGSESHDPRALAAFLDLPIAAVFPISYDLRQYWQESESVTVGRVSSVITSRSHPVDGERGAKRAPRVTPSKRRSATSRGRHQARQSRRSTERDDGGAFLDWYVGGAGFSGSQHPVWPVVAGTVLPFKILD